MNYQTKTWQAPIGSYQEICPDERLRLYIDRYWFSYAEQLSPPARIIPDLCSDLIFLLSPEFDILEATICGPNTSFFYSRVDRPTIFFGIRFYLNGMYPFLKHSLKGLKDQRVALELLEKSMAAALIGHLSGKATQSELIKSANRYFLEQLNHLNTKRVSSPIQEFITRQDYSFSYNEYVATNSLSERSLQRLFREETGLSPYEAFDVLRFQKVYQELVNFPEVKHLDLVGKYDFFDQAHYSRKLKKMTGLTPQEIRQHVGILQDKK
ncbi:hypothetical protein ATZ33_17710 [Enterococcus silesiacus]|uniref:HTH araC/xylS-type domain-containing protein n=1 Tax=Enterococcus silesiacus TaxID=332949 RepID=A0A0S3KFU4_9ENTE|nr:helix-turn-helix domain-containing protein [Enterococcus silesiacus]ALS03144.1 hypothetical protein ATZ33_17710 [Enterococcus silesiacus]OJG93097.1 hypothetical protein RV15_GL002231 [Enterococcus silesiacus]